MTPLETEALQTLTMALRYLTERHISQGDYVDLLNYVRKTVRKLQNKELGCDSGLHSGACTCIPGMAGKYISQWQKKNK